MNDQIKPSVNLLNIPEVIQRIANNANPRKIETITYKNVINYHVDKFPEVANVYCGVCFRKHREVAKKYKYMFIQAYIDEHGELIERQDGGIYGRMFQVASFDEELCKAFGANDALFLVS